MRASKCLCLLAIACGIAGCNPAAPTVPSATVHIETVKPVSKIDEKLSRELADQAAEYAVVNKVHEMFDMMDEMVRERTFEQFSLQMKEMYSRFGQPTSVEWKRMESGKEWLAGTWKTLNSHYFAIETAKHPKGTHFLVVQVVKWNEKTSIGAVQIVTFAPGRIPAGLK